MRTRDLLIVLLGGPLAMACAFWIIGTAGSGRSAGDALRPGVLLLAGTTVWGMTRTDRWRSRVGLLVGVMAMATFVFFASYLVFFLIESWRCPPDAYECPM